MFLASCFRRLTSGRVRAQQPPKNRATRRRSFVPWVESLEDRSVPAVLTVNTLADTVDANPNVTSLREAVLALVHVRLDRDTLLHREFVVMKRGEALPHRQTGQSGHTSLSCARSPSRARARRDFTVPTAIPSEKPISS